MDVLHALVHLCASDYLSASDYLRATDYLRASDYLRATDYLLISTKVRLLLDLLTHILLIVGNELCL
jgi:hypothetical protein